MAEPIDFDATLAAAEGDAEQQATFPFTFLGERWSLPVSPLAKDMLKVRRMYMRVAELEMKLAAGEITEADANKVIELAGGSDMDDLLAMMIGREIVDGWLELGLTDGQLKKVFRYLWRLYNGMDPNEAGQGEVLPPSRGERRAKPVTTSRKSSTNGTSSKRTSSGNTAKTSARR